MSDDGGDPADGLRLMVTQMVAAEAAGLQFPALMTGLALPDICGALGSENGRASGPKTRRWLAEWLPRVGESASAIYGLRCSLLHQGSPHPDDGSPRMILVEANPQNSHILGGRWTLESTGEVATFLDIPVFIAEVASGVSRWLDAHGDSTTVRRNLTRFAHRRPLGYPPFVEGFPVIT